jgi:hypothetical protein
MKIPKVSKRLRESIIERDGGCLICGGWDNLHLHHIRYQRLDREYGNENAEYNLATLCAYHHNMGDNGDCVHKSKEMNERVKGIVLIKTQQNE